jgi:hypothetical protein
MPKLPIATRPQMIRALERADWQRIAPSYERS